MDFMFVVSDRIDFLMHTVDIKPCVAHISKKGRLRAELTILTMRSCCGFIGCVFYVVYEIMHMFICRVNKRTLLLFAGIQLSYSK